MADKTLSQKMEPVLRRPGMYVGLYPVKLLWYLSGMIDVECHFSHGMDRGYEPLHLFLAEKLELDLVDSYMLAVEATLSEEDPSESMALICEAAKELLFKIENNLMY
jgi:hypothetical protein